MRFREILILPNKCVVAGASEHMSRCLEDAHLTSAIASVIVPAHNVEDSLSATIDSVFAQGVPAEVIVVNDGSTDQTGSVAKRYGSRVRYIEQSNQGQGAARNAGLAVASAPYVAFLDADDFWLPGFLRSTVAFLREHPDAVAVSTGYSVLGKRRQTRRFPAENSELVFGQAPAILLDFFSFWAQYDHIRTGTVLLRRSVLERAGPQRADLRISQDLEYWAYIGTFGSWGFIPDVLWVGNSRAASARNWREKYGARRRLCPTVESWEQRIAPRLSEFQRPSFARVRGRVAAGFAHSRVLGGGADEALSIVRKYSADMPRNRVTRVLRMGATLGPAGWRLACGLIKAKEWSKIAWMALEHRPRTDAN